MSKQLPCPTCKALRPVEPHKSGGVKCTACDALFVVPNRSALRKQKRTLRREKTRPR